MINLRNICIIGGGSQGHVIAGVLSSKGLNVSILTRSPQRWSNTITISAHERTVLGKLNKVSNNATDVIPDADMVLLTVPGYANRKELQSIASSLKKGCFVGGVFCSSGFFFEANELLPEEIRLWGFQRVPYIARVTEYGKSVELKGYKKEHKIAVERTDENTKRQFAEWIEEMLGSKTLLLNNYLEASITNSNPILHTARLYTMFSDWPADKTVEKNIPFYEAWTLEAAQLLIDMDNELFRLIDKLPVTPGYLKPLLDYYECTDAISLKNKISSIPAFRNIMSPMVETENGWIPDYSSRYFSEDFGYSLHYIYNLAKKYNVGVPCIEKVLEWGKEKIASLVTTINHRIT